MTRMNRNKTILAIETSSNICGIALIKNGNCINYIDLDASKRHSEILPEMYKKLQKRTKFVLKNIDALAISIGPGSFTGLRIGLSFTKGLAFSNNIPIIPVSTMMALAYNSKKYLPVLGIIHSHAKRVFYQGIKWKNMSPYPNGDIKVADWNDFLDSIDQKENIFQSNCEGLEGVSNFINTPLSSVSVGILADINYNNLVMPKPYDLVSNYVSPFSIGKKK